MRQMCAARGGELGVGDDDSSSSQASPHMKISVPV